MSCEHLSTRVHRIRGRHDAWWYEGEGGIEVVVGGLDMPSAIIRIPWTSIRAVLARLDAPSTTRAGRAR